MLESESSDIGNMLTLERGKRFSGDDVLILYNIHF